MICKQSTWSTVGAQSHYGNTTSPALNVVSCRETWELRPLCFLGFLSTLSPRARKKFRAGSDDRLFPVVPRRKQIDYIAPEKREIASCDCELSNETCKKQLQLHMHSQTFDDGWFFVRWQRLPTRNAGEGGSRQKVFEEQGVLKRSSTRDDWSPPPQK